MTPQSNKVIVRLTLVDGTQRRFTFEPPPNQELRIASRIREFLNQRTIAFQLPDRLLVIPMTQVKSIEFAPPLEKQIEGVFGHAKEMSNG